ncbi:Myotubularin family like protein [Aduncisulcus paluster]|uniref:Myotubularin family like protein n=1 Tax=Aduncisulcus paluster TaxID=2918883 RepID=A0ABQ5K015_9EUKA|nr:Myotubularin family like protein [Aduncisulcus paluster]
MADVSSYLLKRNWLLDGEYMITSIKGCTLYNSSFITGVNSPSEFGDYSHYLQSNSFKSKSSSPNPRPSYVPAQKSYKSPLQRSSLSQKSSLPFSVSSSSTLFSSFSLFSHHYKKHILSHLSSDFTDQSKSAPSSSLLSCCLPFRPVVLHITNYRIVIIGDPSTKEISTGEIHRSHASQSKPTLHPLSLDPSPSSIDSFPPISLPHTHILKIKQSNTWVKRVSDSILKWSMERDGWYGSGCNSYFSSSSSGGTTASYLSLSSSYSPPEPFPSFAIPSCPSSLTEIHMKTPMVYLLALPPPLYHRMRPKVNEYVCVSEWVRRALNVRLIGKGASSISGSDIKSSKQKQGKGSKMASMLSPSGDDESFVWTHGREVRDKDKVSLWGTRKGAKRDSSAPLLKHLSLTYGWSLYDPVKEYVRLGCVYHPAHPSAPKASDSGKKKAPLSPELSGSTSSHISSGSHDGMTNSPSSSSTSSSSGLSSGSDTSQLSCGCTYQCCPFGTMNPNPPVLNPVSRFYAMRKMQEYGYDKIQRMSFKSSFLHLRKYWSEGKDEQKTPFGIKGRKRLFGRRTFLGASPSTRLSSLSASGSAQSSPTVLSPGSIIHQENTLKTLSERFIFTKMVINKAMEKEMEDRETKIGFKHRKLAKSKKSPTIECLDSKSTPSTGLISSLIPVPTLSLPSFPPFSPSPSRGEFLFRQLSSSHSSKIPIQLLKQDLDKVLSSSTPVFVHPSVLSPSPLISALLIRCCGFSISPCNLSYDTCGTYPAITVIPHLIPLPACHKKSPNTSTKPKDTKEVQCDMIPQLSSSASRTTVSDLSSTPRSSEEQKVHVSEDKDPISPNTLSDNLPRSILSQPQCGFASIVHSILKHAVSHRSSGRFPSLSFMHPKNHSSMFRSSQPKVGFRGNRNFYDELYIRMIMASSRNMREMNGMKSWRIQREKWERDWKEWTLGMKRCESVTHDSKSSGQQHQSHPSLTIPQPPPSLPPPLPPGLPPCSFVIFDCRSSLAAEGNKVRKGGIERSEHYHDALVIHLNMDNIHGVRAMYNKVWDAVVEMGVDRGMATEGIGGETSIILRTMMKHKLSQMESDHATEMGNSTQHLDEYKGYVAEVKKRISIEEKLGVTGAKSIRSERRKWMDMTQRRLHWELDQERSIKQQEIEQDEKSIKSSKQDTKEEPKDEAINPIPGHPLPHDVGSNLDSPLVSVASTEAEDNCSDRTATSDPSEESETLVSTTGIIEDLSVTAEASSISSTSATTVTLKKDSATMSEDQDTESSSTSIDETRESEHPRVISEFTKTSNKSSFLQSIGASSDLGLSSNPLSSSPPSRSSFISPATSPKFSPHESMITGSSDLSKGYGVSKCGKLSHQFLLSSLSPLSAPPNLASKTFPQALYASLWPYSISLLVSATMQVCEVMGIYGCSCLVHCSDGWDRTSQVSSLACLLMDPYYRTLEGFSVLIEKEWCSYGHRFASRLRHGGTLIRHDTKHARQEEKECKKDNGMAMCDSNGEYSSRFRDKDVSFVFIQWLEGVYQCMVQWPDYFEFNTDLLLFIANAALSSRYGTFLFDNEQDRAVNDIPLRTLSVWDDVFEPTVIPSFLNHNFLKEEQKRINFLRIESSLGRYQLWKEFWFQHFLI